MNTKTQQPTNVDSGDRLSFTVFIAIAIHALLILGVSFSSELNQSSSPTLEITLASHKSASAPKEADYLAQHNQEASGTLDEAKQITTDTPSQFNDPSIRELSPQPMVKASTQQPQAIDQPITTTSHSDFRIANKKTSELQEAKQEQQGSDKEDSSLSAEIASLRAKLDKQRQSYAKRPRLRRLTSVATKASVDAEYMNKWINKVVFVGNRNFPKAALQNKIFGSLRLATTLKQNGTIKSVEILQSSGFSILDNAALQIVHMASPFPAFPPEIRKDTDQLEIIRTWNFEISGLSTQ
jgi:protein TonB